MAPLLSSAELPDLDLKAFLEHARDHGHAEVELAPPQLEVETFDTVGVVSLEAYTNVRVARLALPPTATPEDRRALVVVAGMIGRPAVLSPGDDEAELLAEASERGVDLAFRSEG